MCRRCRAIDTAVGREHDELSATPFDAHTSTHGAPLEGEGGEGLDAYLVLRRFAIAEADHLEQTYDGERSAHPDPRPL